MGLATILVPLVMAALALVVPSQRWRPWLLPVTAVAHVALVAVCLLHPGMGEIREEIEPQRTQSRAEQNQSGFGSVISEEIEPQRAQRAQSRAERNQSESVSVPSVSSVVHPLSVAPLTAPIARQLRELGGWLTLDAPGRLVLGLVSVLFLLCAFYAVGYLHQRADRPNRIFVACLLGFLGMMSLVAWSHHLGLLWVAVEATTLISAPMIYFNRTPRSLEATWKYLLVCSVGIALALLGSFFLAYAALHAGLKSSLLFEDLLRIAPQLSPPWLHAAFVLLLVGYGTKMGLAPMHTWKPDAYGEAPGVVGALFAGGMTSCAFLAILRIYHICHASGDDLYARRILIFMGLLSMAIAAVFMIRQRDFKRMLAWSSVEHMGILALGIGLGGPALFGALLHLVNNGLAKGVLFLSAGNIHRAYGSKSTEEVRGALRRLPVSGALFLAGFLAITGSPPFGPFVSEFTILGAAFSSGRFVAGALFLVLLVVIFIGMGTTVLPVVQGGEKRREKGEGRGEKEEGRRAKGEERREKEDAEVGGGAAEPVALRPSPFAPFPPPYRDTLLTAAPVVVMMGLVLMLGLWVPAPLAQWLREAAQYLEGRP